MGVWYDAGSLRRRLSCADRSQHLAVGVALAPCLVESEPLQDRLCYNVALQLFVLRQALGLAEISRHTDLSTSFTHSPAYA